MAAPPTVAPIRGSDASLDEMIVEAAASGDSDGRALHASQHLHPGPPLAFAQPQGVPSRRPHVCVFYSTSRPRPRSCCAAHVSPWSWVNCAPHFHAASDRSANEEDHTLYNGEQRRHHDNHRYVGPFFLHPRSYSLPLRPQRQRHLRPVRHPRWRVPRPKSQGQRICRQSGLPARYKDGKCVKKWGSGT